MTVTALRRLLSVVLATVVCWLPLLAAHPMVRNFSKSEYGAGSQNWALQQTPQGVIVVGNQYGMLAFDSRRFTLHGIDYGSAVRTLYVDSAAQRVYAAGSNEFGFFTNDSGSRRVKYHSLRQTAPHGRYGEFWNIIPESSRLWLIEDFNIFRYDGDTTWLCKHYTEKVTASAAVTSGVCLGFENGDVRIVQTHPPYADKAISAGIHSRISAILPLSPDSLVIATHDDGLYLYTAGSVTPYLPELSDWCRRSSVFCAAYAGSLLAVGSVSDGAAVCNITNGALTIVNRHSGLQNNTVLSAAFDKEHNLWLGLDNGLSYVSTNNPVRSLFDEDTDIGSGYASCRLGQRLLLGTNRGLFVAPLSVASDLCASAGLQRVLAGQVWSLDSIGSTVFVCSDNGLYVSRGDALVRMADVPPSWSVTPLSSAGDTALVSTYYGFYILRLVDGAWQCVGKVQGMEQLQGRPAQDASGTMWLSYWHNGVYRLKIDVAACRLVDSRLYTAADGLPSGDVTVTCAEGKPLFSTIDGMYSYDSASDSIVKNEAVDFFAHMPLSQIFISPDNELWAVNERFTARVGGSVTGSVNIDTLSYNTLSSKQLFGYENFNFLSDKELVVGNEDGFYIVDLVRRVAPQQRRLYVSAIYADNDSVVYDASLFPKEVSQFSMPYTLNSLHFEFVMPVYDRADAVEYKAELSKDGRKVVSGLFGTVAFKEFNNLSAGEYVMDISAIDHTAGMSQNCRVTFTIKRPWYGSTTAWIAYTLLLAGATWLAVRYSLRRIRRADRDAARRKDYEIAKLKGEQLRLEVKNKSNELSNSTINLMRKNEILLDISAKLENIEKSLNKGESTHILSQIAKVRRQIRENINHDDDWSVFTDNFDIVYDNFIKRLVGRYPNLTITDLRMCAYIKMGMSSKEIAPLVNISYRSVEMCRYRLRKKMQLARDVSLQEYLANF